MQVSHFFLKVIAQTINDPLIDWQGENIIKIFSFILIAAIAIAIGIFSSRAEHAILFALICTIITIAFFAIP